MQSAYDYSEAPGAINGNPDPATYPMLPGATHANAGEILGVKRNIFKDTWHKGYAASTYSTVDGVFSSDAEHGVLDGYENSPVSNHHDAFFSRNTGPTSSNSLHATYATFNRMPLEEEVDLFGDGRKAQSHLSSGGGDYGRQDPVSKGTLQAQRDLRLAGDEIVVGRPIDAKGWDTKQVFALMMGLYAIYWLAGIR